MSNIRSRSQSRNGNGRNRNGGHRSNNNGRRNNNGSNVSLSNAKSAFDKYTEKAKEALSSGDRTSAENFFQHADHYNRIIIEAEDRKNEAEKVNNESSENTQEENNASDKKVKPIRRTGKKKETTENTEESSDSSEDDLNKSSKIPKELAL